MSNVYKVCTGSTTAELDNAVQICLDANYGLVGDVKVTAVIDSVDTITYLFSQALRLKTE